MSLKFCDQEIHTLDECKSSAPPCTVLTYVEAPPEEKEEDESVFLLERGTGLIDRLDVHTGELNWLDSVDSVIELGDSSHSTIYFTIDFALNRLSIF